MNPTAPTPSQQPQVIPRKILLVEDDIFIADIYNRTLIKAGFLVQVSSDGLQGLQLLNTQHYDCLLLDLMIPGINGLELLKQWKNHNPQSTMPVVILTNFGVDSYMKQAYDLGAKRYFIKASTTPEKIVTEINQLLAETPNTQPI